MKTGIESEIQHNEFSSLSLCPHPNFSYIYVIPAISFLPSLSTAIEIGFTVQRISHNEEFRQFAAIINKSRVSEQTFELKIETGTILTRYGLRATQGEDFQIGGVTQQSSFLL